MTPTGSHPGTAAAADSGAGSVLDEATAAAGAAGAIAERARGCPGVARLSGGPFGTVATYLPGTRLTGVAVDERAVEISIVATLDRPLPETADEVRRAVAELTGERPVNVRIDDIVERS